MPADSVDVYLATIDRLEPNIAAIDLPAAAASIAISLKRIADALEAQQRPRPSEVEQLGKATGAWPFT